MSNANGGNTASKWMFFTALFLVSTILFGALWIHARYFSVQTITVAVPRIVEVPARRIELHEVTTATVRERLRDTTDERKTRRIRTLVRELDSVRTELAHLGYEREIVLDTILPVTLDTVQIVFDDIGARPRSVVVREAPQKIQITEYATLIPQSKEDKGVLEEILVPVGCVVVGILIDHYLLTEKR